MHFSPLFLLQSLLSLFRSPEFSALPRGKILTTDVITYYTPHLMGWYDNDHLIVRLFPSRSLVQWFVGWLDCRLDGSLVRCIAGSMDRWFDGFSSGKLQVFWRLGKNQGCEQ